MTTKLSWVSVCVMLIVLMAASGVAFSRSRVTILPNDKIPVTIRLWTPNNQILQWEAVNVTYPSGGFVEFTEARTQQRIRIKGTVVIGNKIAMRKGAR